MTGFGARLRGIRPLARTTAVAAAADASDHLDTPSREDDDDGPRPPMGALQFLPLLGMIVLGVVVVALIASRGSGAGPSRSELDAAEAAAAQSFAKVGELQAALNAQQQRVTELEAAQGRTQSEAEARVTALEGEVRGLRDQLTTAQASATTEKEARERAERRIQSLVECLNGTTVALQFGRTGSWDPADRALAAVNAACADARTSR